MRTEPDGPQQLTLGQRAQQGFIKVKQEAQQVRNRNVNGSFDRLFGGKALREDPKEFYSRKNQDYITFNSDKYEVKKSQPVRLRRTPTNSVKTGSEDTGPLTSEPSGVYAGNVPEKAKLQEMQAPESEVSRHETSTRPNREHAEHGVDALDYFVQGSRADLRET